MMHIPNLLKEGDDLASPPSVEVPSGVEPLYLVLQTSA